MANAKNLRLGPNSTYIPLTCVGVSCWGNANFKIRVGETQILTFLDTNMLAFPVQNVTLVI